MRNFLQKSNIGFLIIFVLICCKTNNNKQLGVSDSSEYKHIDTLIINDSSTYRCIDTVIYQSQTNRNQQYCTITIDDYIGSLMKIDGLKYESEENEFRCDTAKISQSEYIITRKSGDIIQLKHYKGVQDKHDINASASQFDGEINIKNKYITKEAFWVGGYAEIPQSNKIEYQGQEITYYVITPDPEKAMTPYVLTNTRYVIFVNEETAYEHSVYMDLFGLIFGELDGFLAFLDISYLHENKDLSKLSSVDRQEYDEMGSNARGCFFIIKAMTYKDKQWTRVLKNKNEAYIVIKLNEFGGSRFRILGKNW